MNPDAINIIIPSIITALVGLIITPFLTAFLYKHKMWKKKSVERTTDGRSASLTSAIHNDEARQTPRMGGVIVWGSVLIVVITLYILKNLYGSFWENLSYFSRSETWIPLTTLIGAALFGLIDDYLVCHDKGSYAGGGLSVVTRLFFVFSISLFVACWFYFKLDMESFYTVFHQSLHLGIWIIPFVVCVLIGLYTGGIIDGIDGLSGGVFATMFSAYAVIAYATGATDIAALCMSIVGGILVFLWFNIPPARFFLSETGSMSLTVTLGVIAFLTHQVGVLFIIAFPLILTSASSVIQILSKKFRNGKKVFLVAPLHNHFQAMGWPPYKVVMRYWVVAVFCSITGVVIALL